MAGSDQRPPHRFVCTLYLNRCWFHECCWHVFFEIGKYFGKWIKLYRYLQKINIESVYILTNTSSVIMVKSTRRTHRGIFQGYIASPLYLWVLALTVRAYARKNNLAGGSCQNYFSVWIMFFWCLILRVVSLSIWKPKFVCL